MNGDLRLQEFPKAKFLVLYDLEKREVIGKVEVISHERPKVAKQCVSMRPDAVVAPHGSTCYPSYVIFRRAGLRVFVEEVGKPLEEVSLEREIGWGEVSYSSFRAIGQRLRLIK